MCHAHFKFSVSTQTHRYTPHPPLPQTHTKHIKTFRHFFFVFLFLFCFVFQLGPFLSWTSEPMPILLHVHGLKTQIMELSSILTLLAKYFVLISNDNTMNFIVLLVWQKDENFNANIHFGLMFAFYTRLHIFTRTLWEFVSFIRFVRISSLRILIHVIKTRIRRFETFVKNLKMPWCKTKVMHNDTAYKFHCVSSSLVDLAGHTLEAGRGDNWKMHYGEGQYHIRGGNKMKLIHGKPVYMGYKVFSPLPVGSLENAKTKTKQNKTKNKNKQIKTKQNWNHFDYNQMNHYSI